jgi:predicted nucleic acid-binding Zn ribbon protein
MAASDDIPRLRFIPEVQAWLSTWRRIGLFVTRISGAEERWREAAGPVFDQERLRLPAQHGYGGPRRRYTCVVCHLWLPGLPQRRVCPSPLCQWLSAERRREARRLPLRSSRCPECGRAFPIRRSTGRYCSAACKQRAYRHRRRYGLTRSPAP